MFDFGLGELVLVGIVALIVLGPERLPEAARTAGRLIGRLQRMVAGVKQEFNTQIELEELRRAKQEFEAAAAQVRDSLKETSAQVQNDLHEISDGLQPWERLPPQRTPADFGVDENGNPLPTSDTAAAHDSPVGRPSENTFTPYPDTEDYLTGSFSETAAEAYADARREISPLHTTSLRKQAMIRKRDLRPKFHAKPKLRVRKK